MNEWADHDWAGCCVTLLSDFALEPYGQQRAVRLLFERVVMPDRLRELSFNTTLNYKYMALDPVLYIERFLGLFEFYRGLPCRSDYVLAWAAGQNDLAKWSRGVFLDAIPFSTPGREPMDLSLLSSAMHVNVIIGIFQRKLVHHNALPGSVVASVFPFWPGE